MSTDDNVSVKTNEQIKNGFDKVGHFYNLLKSYLEKDEFNLFKTRSKFQLNKKIEASNNQIQKLIDLKVKTKNIIDVLEDKRKNLTQKNSKIKNQLLKKLGLVK